MADEFKYNRFEGLSPMKKGMLILAEGMQAFGEGLTGKPFHSNYLEMERDKAKMAYEQWKYDQANDPEILRRKAQANMDALQNILNSPSPMGAGGIGQNMGITGVSVDPITGESKINIGLREEDKPMPAETALRYSGALQGIRGIKQISDTLGLNSEKFDKEKASKLIYDTNLAIEGTGARPTFLPFAQGIYRGAKLARAGNEGNKLASYFMTTAENILRARTGAAAPEPEIVREYARSLLKSFVESPDTWKAKLGQVEEFLAGTAKGIRPSKWESDLKGYSSTIFSDGQTATNKKTGEQIIFKDGKWQKKTK